MKKEIQINKYNNGNIGNIYHLLNDQFHRDNDKPSNIHYDNNGQIAYISYCQYGLEHRNYKSACINLYRNGNICYEAYYQNDQRHNDYGPSIIEYKQI